MKYSFIVILIISLVVLSCSQTTESLSLNYSKIDKHISLDTIGGKSVLDPYRNLENLQDTAIQKWFIDQGQLTDSLLKEIRPENNIFNELVQTESKASQDTIIERYIYSNTGEYYILKRHKDENISKLYFKKNLNAPENLLLDPETIEDDFAINYIKIAPDQNKIALGIAPNGNSISTIYILDKSSTSLLPHNIPDVMPQFVGGINWLPDSSGFFYLRFPHLDPKKATYLESTMSYLHLIDKPSSDDTEVFSMNVSPEIELTKADFPIVQTRIDNPNILIARISGNSPYKDVYYHTMTDNSSMQNLSWEPLFKQSDQIDQYFLKNDSIYYRTSKRASNFKVLRAPIGGNYDQGEVLISESDESVIIDFALVDENIYYSTLTNGVQANLFVIKDKQTKEINLPFPSGACGVRATRNGLIVGIAGWTKPTEHFLYSLKNNQFKTIDPFKTSYPQYENLIVEEVEITSYDGVKVPLSIIRRSDSKRNGKNRLKITAYGAYGVSSTPFLDIGNLNWVLSGNIYAVAHVRGGGEKGDAWHMGGFKTSKKNSWKDFIACTKYLIDTKYTNEELTIAFGVSAGGITVANALIERPELYRVGLLFSPFINATRSESQPNGANSKKEFGALAVNEEAQGLVEMDAYLKIQENVQYPAIYTFIGLEDGQVAAWDGGKFIARLQNEASSKGPILLEVDEDGGHGGGGTIHDSYQIISNMDSFALWQTGHPDYQLNDD